MKKKEDYELNTKFNETAQITKQGNNKGNG